MNNSDSITSWFIIANPKAGRNFARKWSIITKFLELKKIDYSVVFTKYAGHEMDLVLECLQQGFTTIISAGGDGTLNNVVNGIFKQTLVDVSTIKVGVIPLGTGNDWIKTYSIPKNITKAIDVILQGKTIAQDIGKINYDNNIKYFANVAGIGFDAFVVQKTRVFKKYGSLGYLLAGLSSLFSYQKNEIYLEINQQKYKGKSFMLIVGICKFCGGGLRFTNNVDPTDGLFDITLFKNLSFFELIKNIKNVYRGSFNVSSKIDVFKTSTFSVSSTDKPLHLQADGELVTFKKAQFQVKSKALRFFIS